MGKDLARNRFLYQMCNRIQKQYVYKKIIYSKGK